MDTVQHPACLLGAQVHQTSVCVCIHLQDDETVIKEVMNHAQGEMGMENLTFEKPLPAGGSMAFLVGRQYCLQPPQKYQGQCPLYLSTPLLSYTACRGQINILAFGGS